MTQTAMTAAAFGRSVERLMSPRSAAWRSLRAVGACFLSPESDIG
jgi:hypothetical protein